MKLGLLTLALSTVVFGLPQGPASPPLGNSPTTISPAPPSPRIIGELPKDGLKSLPYPDFGPLASLLGFDLAKATPDPVR
jgi:hypothetical protein